MISKKISKFHWFYGSFSLSIRSVLSQIIQAWRSILIVSSHLCLSLQNFSFLRVSPQKPRMHLYSPLSVRHAPSVSFCLTVSRKIFGGEKRSGGFTSCKCLNPRVPSSLLGQNKFISTMFSNISACVLSSLLRDRFSHQREKCGQITLPGMLILMLLQSKQEDKWIWSKWPQ